MNSTIEREKDSGSCGCSALLAELDAIRCRLFDLANSQAGNDKGNAACLLHAASSEVSRAQKCLERGNPPNEPIPQHLLAQSLGIFGYAELRRAAEEL